jgi:hypothetical protein
MADRAGGTAVEVAVYLRRVKIRRLIPLVIGVLILTGIAIEALAATPPRGAAETCATRSQAHFPGAFSNPRNLVVGPFVMIGAAQGPAWVNSFGGNKFPLLVRNGHRVTLELPTRTRRFAGLAYGPLPQGETRLRDTHRVVSFVACGTGAPSGSTADGGAVTFWSGGVLSRSPRCITLRVWVDSERSPRRAAIRFDGRGCT